MSDQSSTAIPKRTGEQRMEDALRPFGWTCGPEFWQRYHSDPWVFSLANAVEALSERLSESSSDAPDSECITLPSGDCVAPVCKLHGPLGNGSSVEP